MSRPSLGRNGKKHRGTNSFILNNNSFIKEIEQSENEESPDFRRKEGLRRQAISAERSSTEKKDRELISNVADSTREHTRNRSIFVTNAAPPLISQAQVQHHKRQKTSLASELGRDKSLNYIQNQISRTNVPVGTLYEQDGMTAMLQ